MAQLAVCLCRCSSPCRSQEEVSFSIKRSLGSRKGWKIMPDDGQCELDASALQSVVAIIKDMEIKVSSLGVGKYRIAFCAGICSAGTN